MRGITEKRLKSCLKNRVSLNMETIVRFLITGTVAFSLTACGGGGGGGSSSNSEPDKVKVEQVLIGGKNVDVQYTVKSDGTISKDIIIDGIKAEFVGKNTLIIREDLNSNGYNLKDVSITKLKGNEDILKATAGDIFKFEKNGNSVKLEIGSEGNFVVTHDGIKYEFNRNDNKALATTDSKYGEITYYVDKVGEILDNKIIINGIAAQIKADNSLLILDEKAVSNGYNLEGVTITNKDGAYTFEKNGKSVKLVVGSENNYTITKDGIKYEFNKISDKALATTGSKYGEITYYVSKDGTILDNKITINGIVAQIKADNSLLILDEKAVSNGYNLEGVTITNKDGAYTFEKDGKSVKLVVGSENNYTITKDGIK
ncbi:MAG: hypothetical protein ACRC0Y_00060, partial [Fusobacteriaceae bacterium]